MFHEAGGSDMMLGRLYTERSNARLKFNCRCSLMVAWCLDVINPSGARRDMDGVEP